MLNLILALLLSTFTLTVTDPSGNVSSASGTLLPISAPSASPTATMVLPTDTPTSAPTPATAYITNLNLASTLTLNPNQQDTQRITWLVGPADANDQSTVVAGIKVLQNGVLISGAISGRGNAQYTMVYRQGGQPVPQAFVTSGIATIGYSLAQVQACYAATPNPCLGPMTITMQAFDDSGNLLQSVTETVTVLP